VAELFVTRLLLTLFEREHTSGGGAEREGEADSTLSKEPNEGLDPRTLAS